MTYICGDSGPLDDFNPFSVVTQKRAPEVLSLLNEHPMSLNRISSLLKLNKAQASHLLKDLIRIRTVKEESGIYGVTFAIFTRKDLFILQRATHPMASLMTDSIASRANEIMSLARNLSSAEQVGRDKLLFAALGCFVLDWLGLKILEEEGILIKSKPQPGNRNYVLFARERIDPKTSMKLYDRMYWGSHSDTIDDLVFTSFGDHSGIRYAFPDIIWNLKASPKIAQKFHKMPVWVSEKISTLTESLSKRFLKDIGFLLFKIKNARSISEEDLELESEKRGTLDLANLLVDMNYVTRKKGTFRLNYPVFATKDKMVIEQLGNLIFPLFTEIIKQNDADLRRALRNISPLKNKVAFEEVLNEAWHWTFAQTNRILADRGFFYKPPRKRRGEGRYMAWISEFSFP
jgi:hypothetical protein